MSSSLVQIVHVGEKLFDTSWEYFKNHPDKMCSLTDRASFVTMEEMRIEAALAFDQHFIQAGFKKLPWFCLSAVFSTSKTFASHGLHGRRQQSRRRAENKGRGRNASFPAPPAPIPACGATAPGSCLR
jgi:hypothetical protein